MQSRPLSGVAATGAVRRALARSVAGLLVGVALVVVAGHLGVAIDERRPAPVALELARFGAVMAAVGTTAAGVLLSGRWSRRLVAVRRHGWRPGTATVDADSVRVTLDVAGEVVIDTNGAKTTGGRVLLGGSGGGAVLVFADGRVVPGREILGRRGPEPR
ncbi:hypothetical protein [Actinokineospora globicatena]|uniref:Uncharacterized protein n=1 Tax=Actinokineospora globicatena TaxID=103729 RepID=A0A9W6VA88_9PSEU|nr:hypothetical protein [Actinokineospora globicatena]GLW94067.1 hypothetical protein Aglo03_48830 [Actinokineospora globicatena]